MHKPKMNCSTQNSEIKRILGLMNAGDVKFELKESQLRSDFFKPHCVYTLNHKENSVKVELVLFSNTQDLELMQEKLSSDSTKNLELAQNGTCLLVIRALEKNSEDFISKVLTSFSGEVERPTE